ncbi:MAG: dihydroorotate dehydrogenase electron transfer subunit [Lachnospiraceae bacterium]|nr:dihydroorotate dehydrogenase electron transfer subunit [Lachnospiraceae bacterium]
MKKKIFGRVLENKEIAKDIFDMRIEAKDIAKEAKCGQFVALYSKDKSRMLPRPISLCGIDREKGELRLVFRIAGAGTAEFSKLTAGDEIELMGPLGNGFTDFGKKAILFGGGIGIPPMLELAKSLKERPVVVLGYRDAENFLADEFRKVADVYIATDDGSVGTKGNVIDAAKAADLKGEVIYACGPTPMLRGVKAFGEELKVPAYISMEEKMACGIGACLACVCKSKEVDEHTNVHNKRICKEGPVFEAGEVEL